MRWLSTCAFLPFPLLLLLSCSGTDLARPPESSPAGPPALLGDPAKRAEIERDLVVVVARAGSGEMDADVGLAITATLVNRGKHPHWVVRPGIGSGIGRREPFVYYTAEMETTPGVWSPVPPRTDFWVCGSRMSDWNSDIDEMAPGQSMELGDLIEPSRLLEFPRSGTARLYAHYEYDAGQKRPFRIPDSRVPLPKELEDVGPFSLVSAPLEIHVHVDTSVELSLVLRRRQVRVREELAFAALAEASAVNRTGAPIDLGEDFPDRRFHLEVKKDGRLSSLHALGCPLRLEPREHAALHPVSPEQHVMTEGPGATLLRLRYIGVQPQKVGGEFALRRYHSPWVEVQVTP